MPKKRKDLSPEDLAEIRAKVKKLEKYRATARKNFAGADRLTEELIGVLRTAGGTIDLGDGRTARLQDNFADRNKTFKNQYFVRFDVAIQ